MLKSRYVGKDILFDYIGLNPATAKLFGFTDIAPDECLIRDDLSDKEKDTTLKHEIEENERVGKGESYWMVHIDLLRKYEGYKSIMEAKSMANLIRKTVDIIRKDGQIVISTNSPDRGGDRVNPKGGHFENYMKNPVVMWLHDYRGQTPSAGIPIAKCPGLNVTENAIIAQEPIFLQGDVFAERVKNAWDKDFLKTASIGFAPLSDPVKNDLGGYDYNDWELLEWSIVPIPMNAEAMRVAKDAGFTDLLEVVTKPEETADYIRIPVESPDKHKDHRIRTIDISTKEGIKALYCGECKKVITFLFDKDKGWTMEKAKKWVAEHEKSILIMEERVIFANQPISQNEVRDEIDYLTALVQERGIAEPNLEIASKLFNELKKRIPGSDIPVENIKAMSQKVQDAIKATMEACDASEALIDGHHKAHLSAYVGCKDLIKVEKDGLNLLLPPPQLPEDDDKSLDVDSLGILFDISKQKVTGRKS